MNAVGDILRNPARTPLFNLKKSGTSERYRDHIYTVGGFHPNQLPTNIANYCLCTLRLDTGTHQDGGYDLGTD